MIYIGIFILALLFNFYVTLFGKKDLTKLQEKISLAKFLKELDADMTKAIGDKETTILKIVVAFIGIIFVLVNAVMFLFCAAAILLGTYAAKKLYPIPMVSNYLNKLATYINRLK